MSNPFATGGPPVFGQPVAYQQASSLVPLGDDEDEPFTAAHLAAANEAVVPAVMGGGAAAAPSVAAPAPAPSSLAFTESTASAPQHMGGRIGQPASPVPRVGSAADTALLSGGPAPSAPLGGGGGGGGGAAALGGAPPEDPSKFPFYSIKRYRGLFNVDTSDVLARLFRAVLLFFRGDFLEYVGGNPDLYGPFWVVSTLIFVTAATGNYASYIDWKRHAPAGQDHGNPWYYDVDKVGGSFAIFYGYVGVVGVGLYLVLRWFKAAVTLASVWCIYGYALAAFIPICFVCLVPVEVARWAVVGASTLTSGTFIMLSLRSVIHEAAGAKAVPLYLTMIALHLGLGLALKLYFFSFASI